MHAFVEAIMEKAGRVLTRATELCVRTAMIALRPVGRFVSVLPWPVILAVLSLSTAAIGALTWYGGGGGLRLLLGVTDAQVEILPELTISVLRALPSLAGIFACLSLLAAAQAFMRNRFSLWYMKAAAAAFTVLVVFSCGLAWHIPSALTEIDREVFPPSARNELWITATLRMLPFIFQAALFLLLLTLRDVVNHYTRAERRDDTVGDRILRTLKTRGRDPAYARSMYTSLGIHVFFILILPLLVLRGCVNPYEVPAGSGQPVLQVVKIKKIKKPEKTFVLNLDTAISFYVPKLEESDVLEEVDELTEDTYVAQNLARPGAGGGKEGGWPDGMEDARVRFIRLEYDSGDWDQDMGVGADYNMLLKFRQLTGFNIWHETESVAIPQLKRFPKNRAPPFVYMTGGLEGRIGVSQADVKTLRHYCLDMGGMIFADNGGGNFDRNFRALLRRTFPDLPLVTISYDDVIFRYPYLFPHGAPPLWHHSGNSAMGVKHKGRWVVFYHQGDINDAWKDKHSGASEGLAMQAYKLGVNVIFYAFTQYMQINFGGEVPK